MIAFGLSTFGFVAFSDGGGGWAGLGEPGSEATGEEWDPPPGGVPGSDSESPGSDSGESITNAVPAHQRHRERLRQIGRLLLQLVSPRLGDRLQGVTGMAWDGTRTTGYAIGTHP